MKKNVIFGAKILCDAVYKDENTNKIIIAGMYSGSLVTDAAPTTIKAAVYIDAKILDGKTHLVELSFMSDGKLLGEAPTSIRSEDEEESVSIIINTVFIPASEKKSVFELKASVDGGAYETLIRKKVIHHLMSDPTVSQPQP